MGTKSIDLIVLNKEKTKRIFLAEFTLDQLPERFSVLRKGDLKQHFWSGDGRWHTRTSLAQIYLAGIVATHNLFQKILKGTLPEKEINYEFVAAPSFAYSCPEAYAKVRPSFPKEKAEDIETISIGHVHEKKGIYLSLEQNLTADNLTGSITHEHGHYLHRKLWPEKYQQSDITIIEMMAIYVQEKCNYAREYIPNTPHHRAFKLLRQLEEINIYQQMPVPAQWNFLLHFTKHEELQNLVDVLKPKKEGIELESLPK